MDWRRLIFTDYKAKAALLVMAVFLWFFVVTSRVYIQTLSVPVRVAGLRAGKVLLNDPPRTMAVRFRGRGTSLLLLSLFGNPRLNLDLAPVRDSLDYHLTIDHVSWASAIDVQVLEVVPPDVVSIRVDDEIERTIRVKPMLAVEPAPGYMLVGPLVSRPDSVTVIGPRSLVNHMDFALTRAQMLEGIAEPVRVKLELMTSRDGKIRFMPDQVTVRAEVEKAREVVIPRIPVRLAHSSEDMLAEATPDSVDVMVRGASSALENLSRDRVRVWVELEDPRSGTEEYVPQVRLPEGINLVRVEPATVMVTIRRIGS